MFGILESLLNDNCNLGKQMTCKLSAIQNIVVLGCQMSYKGSVSEDMSGMWFHK
jgi:hypothetical protein